MDPAASELCASQFSKPAKSNKVGLLSSVLDKVRFGRFAVFSVLLFLHGSSCSGINLQDAPQKIQAFVGETVVLPCSISVTDELPTVEWSKEGLGPNIAFLYRDGCEDFAMKNETFRYRTNLIMNELKDGNISLMISDVQLTDAGKYQCLVDKGRKDRSVVKTLELVVGDRVSSCIISFSILLILAILGMCACFFIGKTYGSTETCRWTSKQTGAATYKFVHQGNQAVNDSARLQGRDEELQNQLTEREETQLRSTLSSVLQLDQPTISAGPSTSSPDMSKPASLPLDQRPQVSSAEPPASAHSNHSTQGARARKDSNPGALRQNTPVNPQVKSSSHSKSSPALFMNNRAESSASSSLSSLDNRVYHTRTQSHPPRNAARSPCRLTISYSPSYQNIGDEREKLLLDENR